MTRPLRRSVHTPQKHAKALQRLIVAMIRLRKSIEASTVRAETIDLRTWCLASCDDLDLAASRLGMRLTQADALFPPNLDPRPDRKARKRPVQQAMPLHLDA